MAPRLHAFVISWSGQAENAARIEADLEGHVEALTVIHSDDAPDAPLGQRWERTPNDGFYGPKFHRCLELFDGDVMLQIVADTACEDWPRLARRCREAFDQIEGVGLWAPDVHGTFWTLEQTGIAQFGATALWFVARVDAIVWALSASVLQRLRGLDYASNNLGWGIEKLAALHCQVSGKALIRDQGVKVIHASGRGYDEAAAHAQSDIFLRQATTAEQLQAIVAQGYMNRTRRPQV